MRVMPEFVDLAKSPEQIKEAHSPLSSTDYPVPIYPYGTCICLETEQLDRLELAEDPEVGDLIHFQAIGRVTSAASNETDKGTKRRVEIQITGIALEDDMADDQPSRPRMDYKKLYNEEE